MDNPSSERRITSILGAPIDAIWLLSFNTWFIPIESPWFHNTIFFLRLSVFLEQSQNLSKATFVKKRALKKREHKCCDVWHTVLDVCVWFSSLPRVWKLKSYWKQGLDRMGAFCVSHRWWSHNSTSSLINFLKMRYIRKQQFSSKKTFSLSYC